MNKVILVGRLTADPDVRTGEKPVARYRLAVNRRYKPEEADFINCVAFGKSAEFAQKYMKKGHRFGVVGRIQTGSYTNRDGQKVYTTDVIVDEQYFMETKAESGSEPQPEPEGEWIAIPNGIVYEELPFA